MVRWLAVLFLFLVLSPGKVFAVDSTTGTAAQDSYNQARDQVRNQVRTNVPENIAERVENREQIRQEVQTKKASVSAAICERTTTRIETRLQKYESNQEKWAARHNGVIKRLTNLADKLASRGCEVTQLRADIVSYQTLMDQFAASFRVFHESLQGTRQYACGESQGQFATQLSQARTQLTVVKTNALALQNFFKNTLRLHLRAVGEACGNPANLSPAPTTGDAL